MKKYMWYAKGEGKRNLAMLTALYQIRADIRGVYLDSLDEPVSDSPVESHQVSMFCIEHGSNGRPLSFRSRPDTVNSLWRQYSRRLEMMPKEELEAIFRESRNAYYSSFRSTWPRTRPPGTLVMLGRALEEASSGSKAESNAEEPRAGYKQSTFDF